MFKVQVENQIVPVNYELNYKIIYNLRVVIIIMYMLYQINDEINGIMYQLN